MRVIWYHFTLRSNLRSILTNGLRPRGNGLANDGDGLESNPRYVYLTSRKVRPWHGFDYPNSCMLAIDDDALDEELKREDEDAVRFGAVGTMAYEGVIPPDAIEEIWFYQSYLDDKGATNYRMIEQDFHEWDDATLPTSY